MKRLETKVKSGIMLTMLLVIMFQTAFNFEPVKAVSEAPLADQINACLGEVTNWKDLVNIGIVMDRSSLTDFDTWITSRANASDWVAVLAVKRYAEQAGYSSKVIDDKVKLALSNIPMFKNYSLPKTETSGSGYFWPLARYVLYGYRYAEELNWETRRWNKTSGFLALKSVRDWYRRAFYRCDPDIPAAESLFGTRWHEAGSLMDCFFIFYKLGVKNALDCAIQEWRWLNDNLWLSDHFSYAPDWSGWEFSGISVFPNVAKLHLNETSLGNWSRIATDLQFRYISSLWGSPQWHGTYKVAEHHHTGNPERRLDGTLDAWIMLNSFCGSFNSENRTNMKNMLEGNGVTQAWVGLNASDLKQTTTNLFGGTSSSSYSAISTAEAALCLFLLGISPQDGRGLAIPLISDRASDYASLNYRHFEFDYANHKIKIPVWGGTTLKFMYGKTDATEYFETTGIYNITFGSDWNSISYATKVSNLYSNEYYLWTQSNISTAMTILYPENGTQLTTSVPQISKDLWHSTDYSVRLTAADHESGTRETYYRINDGLTKAVSIDGQPFIAAEGTNNTLEYWSVDNVGNEEIPHRVLTGIKIDKTAPTITITSPSLDFEARSPAVTVTWIGSDNASGISHYDVRLDEGSWINVGAGTSYTYNELGDGTHTIDVKATDNAGNAKQETVDFTVNTSLIGGSGWTDDVKISSTVVIVILIIFVCILEIRRK